MKRSLIIIGGGPAGIGAALQANSLGLDPLLIERHKLGGRLAHARSVRNFPLFFGSGPGAVRRLAAQVSHCGIRVVRGNCCAVSATKKRILVHCADRDYPAAVVILATGIKPKPLAQSAAGAALEYWDDVRVRRGDRFAVIGGGEIAFDQACSLAGRGADVCLLLRGLRPRAFAGLVRDAAALGVKIYAGAVIRSVEREGRHCLITLNSGRSLVVRYVLPAIGGRSDLPRLSAGATRLMGENILVAGDARPGNCRQAAIAFGDGVAAAMRAYLHLKGREE